MKLKIAYGQFREVVGVLEKLEIKGIPSIHRTRLINLITEKSKTVGEEEVQIRKEHCKLDENGELVVKDNNQLEVLDPEGLRDALTEFYNEKFIVDGGDSQVFLKSVKKSLEASEIEWSGRDAYVFAELYEGFEKDSIEESTDGSAE
ncbi:hypothetical protein [Oceanobacillus kimchii]|uniref:Uncharacterized protein n=1 Tax=Oceanobacillus kimchii TaxID=746691 RepID=A0ABQ5TJH5_9BACI|nr:hypothetical protein [Oceanobacillus kimchii]GLO66150.1 hypothetical protein MACH08_19340 [Oceanobacillus kimchii]